MWKEIGLDPCFEATTYHLAAKRAGVTKYRKYFFCFKINWGGNNPESLFALPDLVIFL